MEVSSGQEDSAIQKTILRRDLTFFINSCISKMDSSMKRQTSGFHLRFKANSVREVEGSSSSLKGYQTEIDLDGKVGSIVVHGPSGSGKSTAGKYFQDLAEKRRIPCHRIILSSGNESEPYSCLKSLIRTILGDSVFESSDNREAFIKDIYQHASSSCRIKYDVQTASQNMISLLDNSSVSRENDQNFLNFFQAKFSTTASTIIIYSAEYCDESSWRVFSLILNLPFQFLIFALITTPVFTEKVDLEIDIPNHGCLFCRSIAVSSFTKLCSGMVVPASQSHLRDYFPFLRNGVRFFPCIAMSDFILAQNTTLFEIKGMDEEEVGQILFQALNCDDIPQDLIKNVFDVSSGNPKWCKAVANYIRDYGSDNFMDNIKDGRINDSLLFVIICRVEKLSKAQQTIIKYASVVGTQFDIKILRGILPSKFTPSLEQDIAVLEDNGFISNKGMSSETDVYMFHNDLIHQTIYNLTPKSSAKELHNAIAGVYINAYKEQEQFSGIISRHLSIGETNSIEAFEYSVKASVYAKTQKNWNDVYKYLHQAKVFITVSSDIDVLIGVLDKTIRKVSRLTKSSNGSKDSLNEENHNLLKKFRALFLSLQFEKSQWQIDDSYASGFYFHAAAPNIVRPTSATGRGIIDAYSQSALTKGKSGSFSSTGSTHNSSSYCCVLS
jgi:hypothetical protein